MNGSQIVGVADEFPVGADGFERRIQAIAELKNPRVDDSKRVPGITRGPSVAIDG